jgi:hypothetical protein
MALAVPRPRRATARGEHHRTRADAVRRAAEIEADKVRGTYRDPNAGNVPVIDAVIDWLSG